MISFLEPIDRVNPAVNERQPGRRRQGRRFPPIGDDEQEAPESGHDDDPKPTAPPKAEREEDDGEGHIDIVVAGRTLPTRQALPSSEGRMTLH